VRYTWKANDKKGHFEYLAIAKGKDPRHLNRYAVKRLGVSSDDDIDSSAGSPGANRNLEA
jgi:hypothetical protein